MNRYEPVGENDRLYMIVGIYQRLLSTVSYIVLIYETMSFVEINSSLHHFFVTLHQGVYFRPIRHSFNPNL